MLKTMKRFLSSNTLLCFSPPVMIATIIIELSLALWVLLRYATNTPRRLIIAMLVLLAGFQLAEFNVCSSHPVDLLWSRIGYVFITLLPPLGIHLVLKLRQKNRHALVVASYAAAITFATAFAFLPSSLNQGVCTGNYVIFRLGEPLSALYGYYYIGLVLIGLVLALQPLPTRSPEARRESVRWLAVGYLAFTIPTLIINFLLPATRLGIPSIMCGFAVIFALVAGLKIAPLAKN